ncbi:unnamed protein product, partial [marine sediment metagenome]
KQENVYMTDPTCKENSENSGGRGDSVVINLGSISGEDFNKLDIWDKNDVDKTHLFICISCNRRFRTNEEHCQCGGL